MTTAPVTRPSAPAPTGRRILSQARFETGTLLRNGEQLLVAIVLPAIALFVLSRFGERFLIDPGFWGADWRRHWMDLVMAGVLGLAVVSTAFTGQAISTGFDRRYGVLRYLGTTPLGRGGLLVAKGLAVLVVIAIQCVVLGALGMLLGWRPQILALLTSIPFLVLGAWVFVAFALLFAGTLRAEAVLALANLIWVILVGVGGVLIPAPRMGGFEQVVPWLPSGALGDGMRAALTGGIDLTALGVLLAWGVVTTLAARAWFRWSD